MTAHSCTRQLQPTPRFSALRQFGYFALLVCVLLACQSSALRAAEPSSEPSSELTALTGEREFLTREMDQYQRTVQLLQVNGPNQGNAQTITNLAAAIIEIKQRLIGIAEQEVGLLQRQIAAARAAANAADQPARAPARLYTAEQEERQVVRLLALILRYYKELEEAMNTLPSSEELAQRAAAVRNARQLEKVSLSADKVLLTGAEGSSALSAISERLSSRDIAESRRDIAMICSIRTQLFGALIAGESRSLKAVGKHSYLMKVRLQPGDTTLQIRDQIWQLRLPQDANPRHYLVTLIAPPQEAWELHVFAVDELLELDKPHVPAWLPPEIDLGTRPR